MTQKEKLLKAFKKGMQLTSKQIQTQYKIASPSKVVHRLREDGVKISTAEFTRGKTTTFKYMLASR